MTNIEKMEETLKTITTEILKDVVKKLFEDTREESDIPFDLALAELELRLDAYDFTRFCKPLINE